MSYRESFRPLIAEVLRKNQGKKKSEIDKALREAFPMGPRTHHPWKIWRSEARYQMGLAKDKRLKKGEKWPVESCEGQGTFLTE